MHAKIGHKDVVELLKSGIPSIFMLYLLPLNLHIFLANTAQQNK